MRPRFIHYTTFKPRLGSCNVWGIPQQGTFLSVEYRKQRKNQNAKRKPERKKSVRQLEIVIQEILP